MRALRNKDEETTRPWPLRGLKEPIRVLYFIGDLNPGGSEAHVARLIVKLDRRRIRPELMLNRAEGPMLEDVRASGAPVHDLESGVGARGFVERVLRIRSALRAIRPDVIHAYGYPCDVYASILSLPRRGRRVVTSRRGNQDMALVQGLYRVTNPIVDRVVCVSEATERFAIATEGLSRRRSAVIPNGIDVEAFGAPLARPDTRPVRQLGTLGRLREVKGPDLLVEAFRRLSRPGLTLQVGGPADTPWGVALRDRLQGEEGVSFPGAVLDVPTFLRSLDVFVLPSRSEGMSNALLEAMAVGLPIVATDVGSNAQVLDDGRAGIVVKPDADAISEGIVRLVENPALATELGRRARRHVETKYSLDAMVRRYESFYEELLAGRVS